MNTKSKNPRRRSTWIPGPNDGRILRGYATMRVAIELASAYWRDGQDLASRIGRSGR